MSDEELKAIRKRVEARRVDRPVPEADYHGGVVGKSIQRDALIAAKYFVIGALFLVAVRAVALDFLYSHARTEPYAPFIPTGLVVAMMTWGYAVVTDLRDKLYYTCVTFGVMVADLIQPWLFYDQPVFWKWLYGEAYVDLILDTRGRWFGVVG